MDEDIKEEGGMTEIIKDFERLKIKVIEAHLEGSIDRMKMILDLIEEAIMLCKSRGEE